MTETTTPTDALVLTSVHNGIATITLNRPKALNALNLEMVQAMGAALTAWANDDTIMAVIVRSSSAKALCAGGDIRYFHNASVAGKFDELDDFFAQEYALNLQIARYPKPYIAIMQGVVMGGGMGISATATLRIVTDNSKLAMPETKIGLFPDVGGTHFLSQLDGELGTYLGLTGFVMDAASAQYAGLADVYCTADALDKLLDSISAQRFVDSHAVLHYLRSECALFAGIAPPRLSSLAQYAGWINAAFFSNDLANIMSTLAQASIEPANGDRKIDSHSDICAHAAWASTTLATMAGSSPLMLHVTLKAIRAAKSLSLPQALVAERQLMKRCFATGEPTEGIRALAVDKDHSPQWAHAHWADVSNAQMNELFA